VPKPMFSLLKKRHLSNATGRKRKLWQFHGGVHLPEEKHLSNGKPLRDAPLPAQLVIPLQQHIGAPARACVRVGERVLKGQLIGEPEGYISAPVHASSSGLVSAIEPRAAAHPSGLQVPCVVIETDGADQWAELPEPIMDYQAADAATLRQRIRDCGVVGMGGASFPSNVKLNPGADQPIDTLIINGVECEPYISCDDLLMRGQAADIIDGISIMLRVLGAKQCLVGIEDNKPEAILAMQQAVVLAATGKVIGRPRAGETGSNQISAKQIVKGQARNAFAERIQVVKIPTLYPSGGEKQLIKILTGKEVPSHGIPAQVGIVCQNVGTAKAVADAVLRGQPLIERLVTVSGRGVAHPCNSRVRVGSLASGLIAASGGYRGALAKLVIGGPMMGFRVDSDALPVTKATNCILALTPEESPDSGEPLACIRCGRCAEVCPANLLPQQMYWHARAKNLDKTQDYNLFDCIECGCCAHVCPSHIPLVQYYRYAKTESWAREREKRASEHARERHEAREARIERLERERQSMLRRKKEAIAPKSKAPKAAASTSTGAANDQGDPKKTAIEAARKRAAEKKAAAAKVVASTSEAAPKSAASQASGSAPASAPVFADEDQH